MVVKNMIYPVIIVNVAEVNTMYIFLYFSNTVVITAVVTNNHSNSIIELKYVIGVTMNLLNHKVKTQVLSTQKT